MPNPLRLAVIANAHFDDVRLPFPPAWMQKAGLAMGAPLGRLLGYKPKYDGKGDGGGRARDLAPNPSARDVSQGQSPDMSLAAVLDQRERKETR